MKEVQVDTGCEGYGFKKGQAWGTGVQSSGPLLLLPLGAMAGQYYQWYLNTPEHMLITQWGDLVGKRTGSFLAPPTPRFKSSPGQRKCATTDSRSLSISYLPGT